MFVSCRFELRPLVYAVHVISLATGVLFSHAVTALPVLGELAIDNTAALQSYEVSGVAGHLSAVVASTLDISVSSGAQVDLVNTLVSGGATTALTLDGATATIVGSNINSESIGLKGLEGSQLSVSGSLITGGNTGAVVNSSSALKLIKTNLTGGYADSIGLELQGGSVHASEKSTLLGGSVGVLMQTAAGVGDAHSLVVDNSRIEGQTGSAIVVEGIGAGTAQISVLNGSTLLGRNDSVLEVGSGSNASLLVDNSHLVGNVIVESGGTASLTLDSMATLIGRLKNVSSLTLSRGAQWTQVENSQIGNLSMNEGVIKFGSPEDFYTLSVASLEGSGTFVMDADFIQDKTDFLQVTGNASGNHHLLISSSGTEPLADSKLRVAQIGGGTADFSLAAGRVDLGAFSYGLVREGNEWFLATSTPSTPVVPKPMISPGTRSVLGLLNAAPTVWHGEMTALNSRMGDIRMAPHNAGLWVRTYGSKFAVSERAGLAYTQQQRGMSLGADTSLPYGDDQWLVGLMGGYSQASLDLRQGTTGQVDSYYLGAYSTWMDDDGYYVNGVLKLNRFQNNSSVSMSDGTRSKGDYANNGLGATLEAGQRIKLGSAYYIEPHVQASAIVVKGHEYTLDNGLKAKADRVRSVRGKLGVGAGRDFELGGGRLIKPYVRAAWVQEFAARNKAKVNNHEFNYDFSGALGELGLGAALTVTDRMSLYADIDYSHGGKLKKPYGVSSGLRLDW